MQINKVKLQVAMAKACMNIMQTAEKAGISRNSLNAYMSNRRNPKPSTVGRIAKALNAEVEDLID